MIVYFDMDGVLADLDGMLCVQGRTSRDALKDRSLREVLISKSVKADPSSHYRDIPASRNVEFKSLMRRLTESGVRVEILTSYGESAEPDRGVSAHAGKVAWLSAYYHSEPPLISRFNGVQNCHQKQFFASPRSILVDDQEENIRQWKEAGGVGILYSIDRHEEAISELERALLELN